jgi:hypothetical protein
MEFSLYSTLTEIAPKLSPDKNGGFMSKKI